MTHEVMIGPLRSVFGQVRTLIRRIGSIKRYDDRPISSLPYAHQVEKPTHWAHIGLVIQFLALIRCLGEYFRLKHVQGSLFDAEAAELFIQGALLAAVFVP